LKPYDIEQIDAIKRLTVLAMISDDTLMQLLYFKGGSALNMIYDLPGRASLDLDFSMADSLSEEEQADISGRIKKVLLETFVEEGYHVYDINFLEKPKNLREDLQDFWGGYQVEFKVITQKEAQKHTENLDGMRRNSLVVGDKQKKKFKIDISAHEYCKSGVDKEYESYTIQVYTEEMIVFEKLRALCQQLSEYAELIKAKKPTARGRDYYDIYTIINNFDIDLNTEGNRKLIRSIFEAKRVPLEFIKLLRGDLESHRENFDSSVKDTVEDDGKPLDFDECTNVVLGLFEPLEW
jgi:predicted nucleotidyltransferase component of viral defense system